MVTLRPLFQALMAFGALKWNALFGLNVFCHPDFTHRNNTPPSEGMILLSQAIRRIPESRVEQ